MVQRGEVIEGLHGEVLFTEEDIAQAVGRVATHILENYPSSPLFVELLRGAGPFALDLVEEITRLEPNYHPRLDNMIVSTYDGREAREPRIVTDLAPTSKVEGERVVILDDILDSGRTMKFTKAHIETAGAAEVEVAVLVDRVMPKEVKAMVAGFRLDDKRWLVGKGMDDEKALGPEGGRYLKYIAVALSQPEDE
jgi:hypoxanthine phosphoribosyltransferase